MMEAVLPANWEIVSLGDVLENIEAGKNYRCIERPPTSDETGIVKVSAVTWGDFNEKESKTIQNKDHLDPRFIIRPGDLLMSRANTLELVGASVIVGSVQRKLQLSDKVLRLRLIGPFESWVNFFINSRAGRAQIEALATGAQQSMRNISQANIRRIAIPFPPLNEQQRIVEKIETLFAELDKGEETLREVQTLLARYRQSVLKAAVTGELTADWRTENAHRLEHSQELLERILQVRRETWEGRGKYREPVAPDTSDLPELPEGWVWCSTEQLAEVQTGATPKKGNHLYYSGGKIPWITSTAVNEDIIMNPQDYITDLALQETNVKLFPKGSLIIAMYGEGRTRGMVAELGIEATTNQACAALLVCHLPLSLKGFLKRFYKYNYEAIRILSSGGVQPNLNLGLIRSIPLPLPPEAEQEEINCRLDAELSRVRFVEKLCKLELTRSAALRQSILKEAFAGRLVPQDPNDEPAAELLARIRAKRSA